MSLTRPYSVRIRSLLCVSSPRVPCVSGPLLTLRHSGSEVSFRPIFALTLILTLLSKFSLGNLCSSRFRCKDCLDHLIVFVVPCFTGHSRTVSPSVRTLPLPPPLTDSFLGLSCRQSLSCCLYVLSGPLGTGLCVYRDCTFGVSSAVLQKRLCANKSNCFCVLDFR